MGEEEALTDPWMPPKALHRSVDVPQTVHEMV
jgi:hypothetical protein